ncbi:hypothetical protein RF11_05293 [Thelohanellus kitauei]|uniref:Uncharacterized protein n=1 Tax=Thelohanellus kitauei TaxID=669202 RepID=A0A0C2NAH3_THEKT|nr:hypothetical protein RF11_05293 [Thelohanellus kitauei]
MTSKFNTIKRILINMILNLRSNSLDVVGMFSWLSCSIFPDNIRFSNMFLKDIFYIIVRLADKIAINYLFMTNIFQKHYHTNPIFCLANFYFLLPRSWIDHGDLRKIEIYKG